MKTTILLLLAVVCVSSGCVTRSVTKLIDPEIIKALALDTNSVELVVTAPAFGTLTYRRNLRQQTP